MKRKCPCPNEMSNSPDPAIKSLEQWPPGNQGFYDGFRRWLREGGYSDSALHIYGCVARLAFGWLDKPYWQIDSQADLDRVREYIVTHYASEGTRSSYLKGLAKLADYVRYRCHKPAPTPAIQWAHYLDPLPAWLADDVRAYIAHRRRAWLPEVQYRRTGDALSHLTLFLRWAVQHTTLSSLADLSPMLWHTYLDERLADGRSPVTLNGQLTELQAFIYFLTDLGRAVDARLLRLTPLKQEKRIPRDLPVDQLKLLQREIEIDAASDHAGIRRMGMMDRAWFLLMLHCGLRTGEVRRLRCGDIDMETRRVRIEQSKGLKDRVVYLSQRAIAALQAYQSVRGAALTDHFFTYRHLPLSVSYCGERLRTCGKRCGVTCTPHQLRHSCATLLLNAGAPILTVQMLLGHKYIDTTLGYARLYDGTVAADYYRAMDEIEGRFLGSEADASPPGSGELLALVDALKAGTLNERQQGLVHALRAGILALDAASVCQSAGEPAASLV